MNLTTAGSARAGAHAKPLRAALMLGCLSLMVSASAMSLRELRALEHSDKKQGAIYAQYYVIGAVEGALETNAQVERAHEKPQFCLSGKRLEPRLMKPLFDAELKRNPGLYEADMPVPLVIVNALMNEYPCP